jgi:alkaline phosphatase D
MMHYFCGKPDNSPRRIRGNGIYTSYQHGEDNAGMHLISADLRWSRDDIAHVTREEVTNVREPKNMGPLSVQVDLNDNMIADKKWQWQKHKINTYTTVIGSSLQIILAGRLRLFPP